jgi:hypothetical protein
MAVILNASTSSGFVQSADTSGEIVLQNNGTTRLTVNASGVTIPSLTATTVTGTTVTGTITNGTAVSASGASVSFTGIPSWAKRITVMFNGVSTSGTSDMQIQLGTGASPTYTVTGYVSSAAAAGGTATATSTTGFIVTAGVSSSEIISGILTINNFSSNNWVESGNLTRAARVSCSAGETTLAAQLTAIRVTTVNGTDTFDAGTINIQYEG